MEDNSDENAENETGTQLVNNMEDVMVDEDNNDDIASDDASSLLADVPFMETPGQHLPKKLEEPPQGLTWDDNAILECFQLSVDSHDQVLVEQSDKGGSFDKASSCYEWHPPQEGGNGSKTVESFDAWKPKSLPLPVWGVDPFSSQYSAEK